ncbi:MAG TPA: serine hydrolase [Longimicrobiales bacterium]|nr:serine hydrolase [Longimicrobiales bacterium]
MRRPMLPGPLSFASLVLSVVLPLAAAALPVAAQYVPDRWSWETRDPAQVGMDAVALQEAIAIHRTNESTAPRDQEEGQNQTFGREPMGFGIGPFRVRGEPSGIILRHGYIVAEWGDTRAVEMTHSVTKSFLSTVVGLAWQDGLVRDLDDPAREYMAPVDLPPGDGEPGVDRTGFGRDDLATLFNTDHNRRITWDHLLRQTSDWEGTLWGKPDWADRPDRDPSTWRTRSRHAPGTVYEYNDTRVNLLALLATGVWRRPLPRVLKERVMDPIGASYTWRWQGYDNSWITLDGARVQAVSGGGHWGGGMFISARDMARFGLFTLRRGRWGDRQLLDPEWFELATTPTSAQPGYGFMNFFLNRPDADGNKRYPSAPDGAYAHLGNGTNMVYVDPENDLVVVARWIGGGGIDEFLGKIVGAIRE